MHIFYYGIWLAGVAGLLGLILTALSNHRTLKDIAKLPNPKGKWVQAFGEDLRRQGSEIRNPMVFVARRMNRRKIGHISLHRLKGMVWYAFVFCFLCMGIVYYHNSVPEMRSLGDLLSQTKLAATGFGVAGGLLLLHQLLGITHQERCIRDALLDYMENERAMQIKDRLQMTAPTENLPTALPVQAKPARMPKRERSVRKGASIPEMETAATREKHRSALTKEEEQLLRDMINEFLA